MLNVRQSNKKTDRERIRSGGTKKGVETRGKKEDR